MSRKPIRLERSDWAYENAEQFWRGRFEGKDMDTGVTVFFYATEELEETARLFLMLKDMKTRYLTDAQVAALKERFPT